MIKVLAPVHRAMTHPLVYSLAQRLIGADRARKKLAERIHAVDGERLLDMGCGTAEIVEWLPKGLAYSGFDVNAAYIDAARARWGTRVDLRVGGSETFEGNPRNFDIVLIQGVLHHLDDATAHRMLGLAGKMLKTGGRLITHDPVIHPKQGLLDRFLVTSDRGQFVRTPQAYAQLLAAAGFVASGEITRDFLNVPYSHYLSVSRCD